MTQVLLHTTTSVRYPFLRHLQYRFFHATTPTQQPFWTEASLFDSEVEASFEGAFLLQAKNTKASKRLSAGGPATGPAQARLGSRNDRSGSTRRTGKDLGEERSIIWQLKESAFYKQETSLNES